MEAKLDNDEDDDAAPKLNRRRAVMRNKLASMTNESSNTLDLPSTFKRAMTKQRTLRFIDQEEIDSSSSSEDEEHSMVQRHELQEIEEESKNSSESSEITDINQAASC